MNAAGVDRNDFSSALNVLTRINTPWSPLAWAGQGLIAIGHGEWGTGLGLSLLSMGLAGLLFAGTLTLAERLYYTGWSSMQGSVRKKRPLKTKLENDRRTNGRQPGAVILASETASAAGTPMVISPSVSVPQTHFDEGKPGLAAFPDARGDDQRFPAAAPRSAQPFAADHAADPGLCDALYHPRRGQTRQ